MSTHTRRCTWACAVFHGQTAGDRCRGEEAKTEKLEKATAFTPVESYGPLFNRHIPGSRIHSIVAGNLDASQEESLREIWRRFFALYEKNKDVSERLEKLGGPNAASSEESSVPKNEKDAGKDIPKDDKAKEEAKKLEEMKEMNAFLDKFGGPYLRRSFWEFTKVIGAYTPPKSWFHHLTVIYINFAHAGRSP